MCWGRTSAPPKHIVRAVRRAPRHHTDRGRGSAADPGDARSLRTRKETALLRCSSALQTPRTSRSASC
ncbi:hypothetical protein chiPu_0032164 [Chiloscyllium punctatum]|uniref:Uncharacterized protein n=1 Tax=Chiloscyllium punctatum TaxID=137246 RepID=A0A401TYG9_CHIPU|nr:hypothetical protein [Chiloscyllium punctatum]